MLDVTYETLHGNISAYLHILYDYLSVNIYYFIICHLKICIF